MVCACFGVRNGIGAKAALVSIEQSIMQRGSGKFYLLAVLGEEDEYRTTKWRKFHLGSHNLIQAIMFSQSYGKDIYDLESQPKEFAWKPNGSQPDGGAEAITVTLRRRPGDGADKLNQTANSTSATDLLNLLNTLEGENRKGMEIVDLQLDITVTVTKNGESFAFTRTYDRTVKYDSDGSQAKNNTFPKVYYTIKDSTTKYYRISDLTFYAPGSGDLTITGGNIDSNRLTFHCDTSQQPDSITYTRGAKQSTGTTQE